MAFKDIIGNERIKRILQKSLQKQRLPNSLLLCGPEGVGMRETALTLAKALLCETQGDDACEACGQCRRIFLDPEENRCPDFIAYASDKNVVKVESMRELKEVAYIKPMFGQRRVFIVDEAEKMNAEAANTLLKVLEEPPPFTTIILITINLELILPTIKSRCQILNFSPISQADIEQALRDKGLDEDKAKIVALYARGDLDLALDADWEEVEARRQAAWDMWRALLRKQGSPEFLDGYAFLKRKDAQEELPQVLEIFSGFGRDLMVIKEGGDPRLLLNPDYEDALRRESDALTLPQTLDFLARVDEALAGLDRNLNVGLLVSAFYSSIINRP